MRITFPEGDGERRTQQTEESPDEQDPSNPRGKRPAGQKKKKKKKGSGVGMLTTETNTLIPVTLNDKKEE